MTEFLGKWQSEKSMSDQRKCHVSRGLAGPWKSLAENVTGNSWTGELNEASKLQARDGVGLWRVRTLRRVPRCTHPPSLSSSRLRRWWTGNNTKQYKEFIKAQRRNKPARFLTKPRCTLLAWDGGVSVFAGFTDFHIYNLFCAAGGKNVLQLEISAEDARVWRRLRYSCIFRVAAAFVAG